MGVHPLDEKFKSFNWHTLVIEDGHDFDQVREALDKAATLEGRPKVIIAHTIKGKGISYMENVAGWHGKAPDREHLGLALDELKKREDSLTPAQ